jgi:Signal peptidase I
MIGGGGTGRRPGRGCGMRSALIAAGVIGTAVAAGLAARRRFLVVRVAGTSMLPTYRPGDRVLIRRTAGSALRRGQVVVFHFGPPPRRAGLAAGLWQIKRVAAVPGDPVPEEVSPAVDGAARVPDGRLVVLGDGVDSRDSRHWGYLPMDRVLGVVVRELSASGRGRA